MFPYEGPQNELRSRIKPPTVKPSMPDMPLKPEAEIAMLRAEVTCLRERLAKERDRPPRPLRPPTARETTERRAPAKKTTVKRAQTGKVTAKRPVKPLPPMRKPVEEQPRDALGRFARKTGAVLWGATKATARGTVRAVKGTAKAVGKVHRTVKRVQADSRRRARLEGRERRISIAEREKKLGLRKKKIVRRRVK